MCQTPLMGVPWAAVKRIVFVSATALLTGAFSPADEPVPAPGPFDPAQFLRAEAGFSASDIQRIQRGEVIVHGLDADDATVAIAAVALIAVPPAFFLQQVRRIEEFKKSAEVLQIAKFGVPPSAADLGPLALDKGDIDAARECRPGSCDLKLDARGIEKLRAVPPTGDVMAAFRTHLAEYATGYLAQGNAALMTYHDRGRPAPLHGELERILRAAPFIAREWPDLSTAVGSFTGKLPEGLQNFTYWSKEKVGPRASVTITHLIIRPPTNGVAVVASKQIYASHYATASLGLTILVDQGNAAGPRTLLIYTNRTRVDMFGGLLGGVKRTLVRSRAKSGAERMMGTLRTKLQLEYGLHGKSGPR